FDDVQIAVAYAARHDADHDLTRARRIHLHRLDGERFVHLVEHCGLDLHCSFSPSDVAAAAERLRSVPAARRCAEVCADESAQVNAKRAAHDAWKGAGDAGAGRAHRRKRLARYWLRISPG